MPSCTKGAVDALFGSADRVCVCVYLISSFYRWWGLGLLPRQQKKKRASHVRHEARHELVVEHVLVEVTACRACQCSGGARHDVRRAGG